MSPHPVLMPFLLFPKLIPQRLHARRKRRRSDGEKQNAGNTKGKRRKLVEQAILRADMVAMRKVIDGGATALVHAHRVDINPETQNPIVPIILNVGREHHQVVIYICPYIGYQTTTLSNARGRETGVDGGEEMSYLGSHVESATEVSILRISFYSNP